MQHVLPEDGDPFFVEVEEVNRALLPGEPGDPPPRTEEVEGIGSEMTTSGRFGEAAERRYLWDVTYSADEYVAVLNTYSGHRARDDATRRRLLAEIHRRIEARPGRAVRKTYPATLTVAPRL